MLPRVAVVIAAEHEGVFMRVLDEESGHFGVESQLFLLFIKVNDVLVQVRVGQVVRLFQFLPELLLEGHEAQVMMRLDQRLRSFRPFVHCHFLNKCAIEVVLETDAILAHHKLLDVLGLGDRSLELPEVGGVEDGKLEGLRHTGHFRVWDYAYRQAFEHPL